MLNQIRIVLVNTSHPGNIGSVARAMKTMGLSDLYLVAPQEFPHQKAYEMAVSASDVLDEATVVGSLDEAVSDCRYVVGTSARTRVIPWPKLTPRELANNLKQETATHQVAILFGCEQSGLSNDELERCHAHVEIPANPVYSSLNLAQAVQIIAYECYVASLDRSLIEPTLGYRLASADEMEKFFTHLQEVMVRVDFLKPNQPRKLMTRLRRLFLRARVDENEMNILRGILTAVEHTIS